VSGPPADRGWRWTRAQLGGRLSRIGERMGWESWVYNPFVFAVFQEFAAHNAPIFADAVQRLLPEVKSVADVGCGTGGYLAEFNRRGLKTRGWEYAARGRAKARRAGVEVHPFDVSISDAPEPPGRFDLAMTIEVAEHIPDQLSGAFLRFLTALSDTVIFTAAQPGQGGQGHINERLRVEWAERFVAIGFQPDEAKRDAMAAALREGGAHDWLSNNLLVLRRRA